jgi:hypothetical protein
MTALHPKPTPEQGTKRQILSTWERDHSAVMPLYCCFGRYRVAIPEVRRYRLCPASGSQLPSLLSTTTN